MLLAVLNHDATIVVGFAVLIAFAVISLAGG